MLLSSALVEYAEPVRRPVEGAGLCKPDGLPQRVAIPPTFFSRVPKTSGLNSSLTWKTDTLKASCKARAEVDTKKLLPE